MAERMKPMGMDRALSSKDSGGATSITDSTARLKHTSMQRTLSRTGSLHQDKRMGAKYDPQAEAEVRHWFKQLLNEDIGEGSMTVEKNLKDGILLIKLLQKLYEGTPNKPAACDKIKLKFNTSQAPFKQMENIELFLKGANAYGVPDNSLFQTVDLYEGRNMAMVIATILQVGTEAQRYNFNGPTCGSKPVEKHQVEFSYEQLKQSHGVIGLQSGTNKFATQKGMRIGAVRHIADIRADDLSQDGQNHIGLQAGSNQFASQKGMTGFGAVRHISDIRADQYDKESNAHISLQSGTNKFDSQKGMRGGFGAVRHISDIRADQYSEESKTHISLQSGTNQFASQKGMTGFGAVRHIADIRADDLDREAAAEVSLQYGTNRFDSQKGMTSFGAQRHVSDIKVTQILATKMSNVHRVVEASHGVRMIGSAAVNLCMVASGSGEAYYEYGIHIWDFAAAGIIFTEAGGLLLDPAGGEVDFLSRRVMGACNQEIADQLSPLLNHIEFERD